MLWNRLVSPAFVLGAVATCLLVSTPLAAGENYALLVAVGDYDIKELRPLKYTRADVLEFHQALLDSGFASKNIVLMHDDMEKLVAHCKSLGPDYKARDYLPEGEKIRRELQLLLGRLKADDSVIVAFAGHGVQFKGAKKSFYCPSDCQLEKKNSLIGIDEVYAALSECSATRKLFLVDACQNDPQTGLSRSRQSVDLESVTRPQTETVPEGIIALFSCKAGQKSFEHPDLGHGVFFYHLLDGWKGNGDLNGDGKISYQELASYTEKKTSEFAALKLKVLQTPQLRADFSGEWILRDVKAAPLVKRKPLRVLLVGINDYESPDLPDLQGCLHDVNELAIAFHGQGCAPEDLVMLSDETGKTRPSLRPTRANIVLELQRLSELESQYERVIIALTGSGVQFPDIDIPLYLPSDASPRDPSTYLSMKLVESELRKVKSPAKIVLMDTCRTTDGLKKLGVTTPAYLANVTKLAPLGAGDVSFFFSCSGGEEAYENNELLHGAFTYSLLEGLKGPADSDRDGQVTLGELSKHLKSTVPNLAKSWRGPEAKQTPDIRMGTLDPASSFGRVERTKPKIDAPQ